MERKRIRRDVLVQSVSRLENRQTAPAEPHAAHADAAIDASHSMVEFDVVTRHTEHAQVRGSLTKHLETRPDIADQREEVSRLREEFQNERKRWQDALADRERELNEASAAVERAARSLELQRLDFEKVCRQQAEAQLHRQSRLEEKMQSLAVALQQQQETVSVCEEKLLEGIKEIENARRRLQRQQSLHDNECEVRHRPLILESGPHNEVARAKADQLSYEVCDRLVRQRQTWGSVRREWIVGSVITLAGFCGLGYLLWNWLHP